MTRAGRRLPWLIGAGVLTLLVLASPRIYRAISRRSEPPAVPVARPPASAPLSRPATTPAPAPKPPPLGYAEVVKKALPRLAATRPLETSLDLEEAAHYVLREHVYIDASGRLWVTRYDAPPTEEVLPRAYDEQVIVTRERVAFVYWSPAKVKGKGQPDKWAPTLVCEKGSGWEAVSAAGRREFGAGRAYDFSAAWAWEPRDPASPDALPRRWWVVPTATGVSLLDVDDGLKEHASPPLLDKPAGAEDAAALRVQVLLDPRGLIAWLPPTATHPGGRGIVRFVDGAWQRLGAPQGFGERLIHVIPLLDGSAVTITAADDGSTPLAVTVLDPPKVNTAEVARLIAQLSADDPAERDAASVALGRYGPELWPIAQRYVENQPPETKLRLRALLGTALAPTLGGMTLVSPRLKLVSRQPDGGALFHAEQGVQFPGPGGEPRTVAPAWIAVRPGSAVRLLETIVGDPVVGQLNAEHQSITTVRNEWVVTSEVDGPQFIFGGELVPLLRKAERNYSEVVAIDQQGRWFFRQPGWRTKDDPPTLVVDPTFPDPTPRLPVWHIHTEGQTVGWTRDGWPVRKAGSAWALGAEMWRQVDESKDPLYADPATQPAAPATTAPATAPADLGDALLVDPDGNRYFDGKAALRVRRRDGSEINWPLPTPGEGIERPCLVRAADGRLFLYNTPGRLLRIRPTPGEAEPFTVEASFTHKIPDSPTPARVWLDPAGRIIFAWDTSHLSVMFPDGRIPKPIATMMPASELDSAREVQEYD